MPMTYVPETGARFWYQKTGTSLWYQLQDFWYQQQKWQTTQTKLLQFCAMELIVYYIITTKLNNLE